MSATSQDPVADRSAEHEYDSVTEAVPASAVARRIATGRASGVDRPSREGW